MAGDVRDQRPPHPLRPPARQRSHVPDPARRQRLASRTHPRRPGHPPPARRPVIRIRTRHRLGSRRRLAARLGPVDARRRRRRRRLRPGRAGAAGCLAAYGRQLAHRPYGVGARGPDPRHPRAEGHRHRGAPRLAHAAPVARRARPRPRACWHAGRPRRRDLAAHPVVGLAPRRRRAAAVRDRRTGRARRQPHGRGVYVAAGRTGRSGSPRSAGSASGRQPRRFSGRLATQMPSRSGTSTSPGW